MWLRTKVIAAMVAPQAINDARNVNPTLSQRFGYFDSCGVGFSYRAVDSMQKNRFHFAEILFLRELRRGHILNSIEDLEKNLEILKS
jgi:hypothetical protein